MACLVCRHEDNCMASHERTCHETKWLRCPQRAHVDAAILVRGKIEGGSSHVSPTQSCQLEIARI